MGNRYIFSSESVGEGHPDKVADTISDAVLDACLTQDKFSRVACETYVKSNVVIVGGEITTKAKLDVEQIARKAIREIGYVNDDDVFHADRVFVNLLLTQQSADIAQGVDARKVKGKRTATAGRRRPGPDVRLREQRNAGADAGADHVRASPRPDADQDSQGGRRRMAAARREIAGLGDLRRRQAGRHLERRHLHAARRRAPSTARSKSSASTK